jgi:hypothetical protein
MPQWGNRKKRSEAHTVAALQAAPREGLGSGMGQIGMQSEKHEQRAVLMTAVQALMSMSD